MIRQTIITLVSTRQAQGPLGQWITTPERTDVPCFIRSVTRQEWTQAGQRGFAPVLIAAIFSGNYSGQSRAILDGQPYAIYRTYDRDDEITELYLEYQTGVNNGTT